jgi:hypothetical protein
MKVGGSCTAKGTDRGGDKAYTGWLQLLFIRDVTFLIFKQMAASIISAACGLATAFSIDTE